VIWSNQDDDSNINDRLGADYPSHEMNLLVLEFPGASKIVEASPGLHMIQNGKCKARKSEFGDSMSVIARIMNPTVLTQEPDGLCESLMKPGERTHHNDLKRSKVLLICIIPLTSTSRNHPAFCALQTSSPKHS
jgi:hypothetical protein